MNACFKIFANPVAVQHADLREVHRVQRRRIVLEREDREKVASSFEFWQPLDCSEQTKLRRLRARNASEWLIRSCRRPREARNIRREKAL